MIIRICDRAGFFPKVVHEVSQIHSIVRLVENNLGYSIIPSGAGEVYKENVKFFELKDYPERAEISLAYNPVYINDLSKKVIDLILKYKF